MNFTLALLAGLILLLPGIAALAAWNVAGGRDGARRQEFQLTSPTALFGAIIVALASHGLGWALLQLSSAAAIEFGELIGSKATIWPDPYLVAFELALQRIPASSHDPVLFTALAGFVLVVLLESLAAFLFVGHEAVDLLADGLDLRSQGWGYQSIVRPVRHGYTPIAYVHTTGTMGEYGIGYSGVIADARQGADGELKVLSLGRPYRFLFKVRPSRRGQPAPEFQIFDGQWEGGTVILDASKILSVSIHSVREEAIDELEANYDDMLAALI